MNKFAISFKPIVWSMGLVFAALLSGCGSSNNNYGGPNVNYTTPPAQTNPSAVNLDTAANYAIFADSGITTDANPSDITGNIGVSPEVTSTAISGFALNLPASSPFSTSTQVSGNVYAFDYADPTPAEVAGATADMLAAYLDAEGRAVSSPEHLNVGAGTLTNLTLGRGVYVWGSAVTIPENLTLHGSATDVWILKVEGTLGMAAAKNVYLTGGARARNVFWQVSGAVSIGANTDFKGIILGASSITFGNSSSINGRLLASTAVTLDATTVTQP